MTGFTLVDGIVLAIIILSAVLAYARGLAREALSIAGWLLSAFVAYAFAPAVEPLLREVPYLRDVIGSSCQLGVLAGFAVVFAAAIIVTALFTPLLAGAVANSAIGPVDQGLGFLFGVARGVLLVVIALVVYNRVYAGGQGIAQIDNSQTVAIFAGLEERIAAMLPVNTPEWLTDRYTQLMRSCS